MSLLIVMFQSRRRKKEWKRRVVHSRRWVRGSMGLRVASDGPAGRVGWAFGSRRMGLRVASDGPSGRVGWARGSRRMGPRVASDGPAGRVGRSCCTANRAEEGNAARMRREERLDRQGSGKRADAEIANRTARSGQRREEQRAKDWLVFCQQDGGQRRSLPHLSDLTQHSPAQSRDAA